MTAPGRHLIMGLAVQISAFYRINKLLSEMESAVSDNSEGSDVGFVFKIKSQPLIPPSCKTQICFHDKHLTCSNYSSAERATKI